MRISASYALDLGSFISEELAVATIQIEVLKRLHENLLTLNMVPKQVREELIKIISAPAVFALLNGNNLKETIKNSKDAQAKNFQIVIFQNEGHVFCATLDDGKGFSQAMINKDNQPRHLGFADYRKIVYPQFNKNDAESMDRYYLNTLSVKVDSLKVKERIEEKSVSGGSGIGITMPTKILHLFAGTIEIGNLDTLSTTNNEMLKQLALTQNTILPRSQNQSYHGAVIVRESPVYQNQLEEFKQDKINKISGRAFELYQNYLNYGAAQIVDTYFKSTISHDSMGDQNGFIEKLVNPSFNKKPVIELGSSTKQAKRKMTLNFDIENNENIPPILTTTVYQPVQQNTQSELKNPLKPLTLPTTTEHNDTEIPITEVFESTLFSPKRQVIDAKTDTENTNEAPSDQQISRKNSTSRHSGNS